MPEEKTDQTAKTMNKRLWYNSLCMLFSIASVGIIFNAFVTALVSSAAFALTVVLLRRWHTLTQAMRAYTWFWFFTGLLWFPSAIRYAAIGVGYLGPWITYLDVIIQTAVFLSGPPLFYYLGVRIFKNTKLAGVMAGASTMLGFMAIWFILQPDGVPLKDVTAFSAEATINPMGFVFFGVQIALAIPMLLFTIGKYMMQWWTTEQRTSLFSALYASTLLFYLLIGSIDESKIITDWSIVIFRLLYAATFLFIYVLLVNEGSFESYITKGSATTITNV